VIPVDLVPTLAVVTAFPRSLMPLAATTTILPPLVLLTRGYPHRSARARLRHWRQRPNQTATARAPRTAARRGSRHGSRAALRMVRSETDNTGATAAERCELGRRRSNDEAVSQKPKKASPLFVEGT